MGNINHPLCGCADLSQTSIVIEIGIGGGQATLPLLKTDCRSTAVEYGESLAGVCSEKSKGYPNFSVVVGKFENSYFESNSCDLIFSASAFHWIPEEIGYQKFFGAYMPKSLAHKGYSEHDASIRTDIAKITICNIVNMQLARKP